jgi:chemotaxis protein CheZ
MKFDETGDSDELQALFDSIAAQPAKPRLEVVSEVEPIGDSDDLQALFDSVADNYAAPPTAPGTRASTSTPIISLNPDAARQAEPPVRSEVFHRVGHMARELHDMLRELGYDRMLQDTARAMPDTRERLAYIAQMTEQAASRVLNATDIAKPIQEKLQHDAEGLAQRWDGVFGGSGSVEDFKNLAGDTRVFLKALPTQARATGAQLTEIMMAQDFQDLTGQVIRKVVEMSQRLEDQLLRLLVEVSPDDKREGVEGLLNGPVINGRGRDDVVVGQAQVDELLESLGF